MDEAIRSAVAYFEAKLDAGRLPLNGCSSARTTETQAARRRRKGHAMHRPRGRPVPLLRMRGCQLPDNS